MYQQSDQFLKAIADFSDAIRLNPNYAPAYWWRGKVYVELGHTDLASAEYYRWWQLQTSE
jgi:Tfp pilus assembly protein PilF